MTLTPDEVDRAAKWLHDKGGWTVAVGRLIPGVRSLISIPAGLSEMPVPPFLAYTIVGTPDRTVALAYAGRLLGSRFDNIYRYLGPAAWIIVGLAFAMISIGSRPTKARTGRRINAGPHRRERGGPRHRTPN